MKKTKLLLKLQSLFNPDREKNKNYAKELKSILRKLKKKEANLLAVIDMVEDPELLKLYKTELEIIRIQRKKGLDALQEIRNQLKKN
ncbi:MAG: hypothetical protein ACU85E_05550 [Gammaproteobacteria bacterium]